MEEITRTNSAKFNIDYFMNQHPMIKKEEIESYMYISPYDIFIKFKDGRKYIYDQSRNYLRPILYKHYELTEEEFKKEFSIRLRSYMGRHHITQEDMAKRIGTGQTMLYRYCNGLVLPSIYKMQLIANVLGYPLESFFYIDIDHVYNA